MPSRPTDLQKVYVEELFFLGQSLRICPREGDRCALTGVRSWDKCASHSWMGGHPGPLVNTSKHTERDTHAQADLHT